MRMACATGWNKRFRRSCRGRRCSFTWNRRSVVRPPWRSPMHHRGSGESPRAFCYANRFAQPFEAATMANQPEDRVTEAKMDPENLYLEEIFTDRRVGTIRRLTP